MKKILLLEDRVTRQTIACNKVSIVLSNYSDILENAIDTKFNEYFKQFKNGLFKADNFSAVIVHKSAFGDDNQDILFNIESICKKYMIPLVYFSGVISIIYYIHSRDSGFEKLEINSKVLYSNNFKLFLEHFREFGKVKLSILGYGKSWKLNILLNILEKMNLYLNRVQEDYILFNEFVNETGFELLKSVIGQKCIDDINMENGWVCFSELKGIQRELEDIIRQRILCER